MVIEAFPPIESANKDGLLALGGDLEVPSLVLAYRSGIFPWPVERNIPIPWFSPALRSVLLFDEFHIPKSVEKVIRQGEFTCSMNTAFEHVIQRCASIRRRGSRGTWITDDMVEAYCNLHDAGYAESVEVFRGGVLVGGLYGVSIDKMFAGESMFHEKPNASKVALVFLVKQLQSRGFTWLDCQQQTSLLESFGAREIPRNEFISLLRRALSSPTE